MPVTPYVGMPAGFRNCASDAPGSRAGTTGLPGHSSCATFSMGSITRRVKGAGAAIGPRISGMVTVTLGSLIIVTSCASTASRESPGKIRHELVAFAKFAMTVGVAGVPIGSVASAVEWLTHHCQPRGTSRPWRPVR